MFEHKESVAQKEPESKHLFEHNPSAGEQPALAQEEAPLPVTAD